MDGPSIDISVNRHKPVHVLLLGNNIPVLEYAANLDSIPPNGTTIFLGAIKTRGGTGGPVRAVAFLDDDDNEDTSASRIPKISTAVLVFMFTIVTQNVI